MAHITLERRTFLRGLGTVIALPFMESLLPSARLSAAEVKVIGSGLSKSGHPIRMAYVYTPNGVNMGDWRVSGTGKKFELSKSLSSLAPVKNDISVISDLSQKNATGGADGPGDHARANATFLTGVRARKTAGSDIQLGISADQVAAQQIGDRTPLPSLELSCDRVRKAGSCDSGYSCAYQFNLSWANEQTPVLAESNPRAAFERLFGAGEQRDAALQRRLAQRSSILDYVLEDAKSLGRQLGANDRRKLEEYLSGVRDVERRIEQAEKGQRNRPDMKMPDATPAEYEQHIALMFDLMVAAFQTDTTRISTFLTAHDGSDRSFKKLGVTDGHHTISHHLKDPAKLASIAKIDTFYAEQFSRFLQRLKSIKEGDGTLLDNCMIVYGSGISDGNRHNHNDLPVILAGRAGGTIASGRHLQLGKEIPMTNLYISMLERMGVQAERVGDSSGKLEQIATA